MFRHFSPWVSAIRAAALGLVLVGLSGAPAAHALDDPTNAVLRVRILQAGTGAPADCTVTLADARGRIVTQGQGFRGGFRCAGGFTNSLPPGRTRLRITCGPEFKALEQEVELQPGETRTMGLALERQVDLRARGWVAGDSHDHMIHGEHTLKVTFDEVALSGRAEGLRYLSLAQAWELENPTPERLEAAMNRASGPDFQLTWNLEAPKNYFKGDAGRCLGHCWTLAMRGRTTEGADVIQRLLQASAMDYESAKPSFADFESHALIHAQGGAVFYTHPARWWTGPWGGEGGYPKQEKMRVSNMAVELPLDTLLGPTFDGLDVITGAGEFQADQKAFQIWALLLNHGYRVAATASSDACFDRPGGAVPGTARLYTLSANDSSPAVGAARAARAGQTFATTGPLVIVSVDGEPPGSAFAADGKPHRLSIEAWASGAAGGGLGRMEILRNGEPAPRRTLEPSEAGSQAFHLEGQPVFFQTNLVLRATSNNWYCVRVFGTNESRQRAISGAFFFEERPWRSPAPLRARIRARVMAADTGQAVAATLTEVQFLGTEASLGAVHRLSTGAATLSLPGTRRLRAEAPGFEPLTLSPVFDHPPLVEFVTRLQDKDLVDWSTFERIREMLSDVPLTFQLVTRDAASGRTQGRTSRR